MIEKLKNWLAHNLDYLGVGVLAISLIVINFPRNNFLIGWDNLQTEMNVGMNIARNFSGVWQEYQGLGLLAGMAHASDLMRLFIQWVLSFIVPLRYLRSTMIFGMYFLGAIGMVKLVRSLLRDSKWVNWSAFLAGVFYMLNIGTVQNFWAVFEPYAWAYGFAPWLLALITDYLRSGRGRDLWWFFIVSLLATPMAYIQTIFVVYGMTVFLFIVGYLIDFRKISFLTKIKRSLASLLIVISVNSFWLMPQVYFFLTSVGVTVDAKMNRIATPEVELSNNVRGSLMDVAKMEGYWLDLHDTNTEGEFDYLMSPWVVHLANPSVEKMQLLVVIAMALGMLGVFLFNYHWKWALLFVFISIIGILQTNNFPLGFEKLGLYEGIPILSQIFRSSFTKIVVFMSIFQSLFFGFSITILMQIIYLLVRKNYWMVNLFLTSIFVAGTVYVGIPIIQGNLLYRRVEQKLPDDYLSLNNFFENSQDGRIAKLPANSLWGWQYNSWGYDGSGFLWYGIEQPILDRAFDVWSPYNEGFYNEFSNALYSCSSIPVILCSSGVAKVLQKYDVRYVLMDESVIAPGQDKEILRIEEMKKIASELGWERVFNEGFLTVYEIPARSDLGVTAPSTYTLASGDVIKTRKDVVYSDIGTYISSNRETPPAFGVPTRDSLASPVEESPVITYPFAWMMKEEIKGVEYGDNGTIVSSTVPQLQSDTEAQMVVPGWGIGDIVRIEYENGKPMPVYKINGEKGPVFLGKEKPEEGKSHLIARVSEGEEWREYIGDKEFKIEGSKIEVEISSEPTIYDFGKMGSGKLGNCDVLKRGEATKTVPTVEESPLTQYVADGRGAACDYVEMKELDTRLSYLMRVQGENKEGRSLKFFLYNTGSKRNDIEYLLGKNKFDQTFSLLPWEWDGFYSLNIETRSFGQRAENIVSPVEVRWFPLEQIAGAKIVPLRSDLPTVESAGWDHPLRSDLLISRVKKVGTWLYIVETKNAGLLRLSQGYDEGWVSPWVEHVKVDGWANGWMVPGSVTIAIFYWPQLLEYLGFGMLGVTIVLLLRKKS